MDAARILIALSVAMVLAGLYSLYRGWKLSRSESIAYRLRENRKAGDRKAGAPGTGPHWLLRAGIAVSDRQAFAILAGALLAALLAFLVWGLWPALILVVAVVLATTGLLRWRYRQRLSKMIRQLPGALDHMIRSLKSGRTLGDAMTLAMARCQNPLREALLPTRRSIELGISPGEALEEFAALYKRDEFHILAMGIRVNQRYGGNAIEVLDSLIVMIRDREKASRHLRALTGETRISAVVLAVLPVSLAVYIFFSNPSFLLGLVRDPGGLYLLFTAIGLQLLGCYLLWRMVRSI